MYPLTDCTITSSKKQPVGKASASIKCAVEHSVFVGFASRLTTGDSHPLPPPLLLLLVTGGSGSTSNDFVAAARLERWPRGVPAPCFMDALLPPTAYSSLDKKNGRKAMGHAIWGGGGTTGEAKLSASHQHFSPVSTKWLGSGRCLVPGLKPLSQGCLDMVLIPERSLYDFDVIRRV
jgi:hypothetical protein